MGGLDFAIVKLTEYLKHAGFEVEKFAQKVQSFRNEVSEGPAYTDRYMSYKRGTDMIKNRGELFDMQAYGICLRPMFRCGTHKPIVT